MSGLGVPPKIRFEPGPRGSVTPLSPQEQAINERKAEKANQAIKENLGYGIIKLHDLGGTLLDNSIGFVWDLLNLATKYREFVSPHHLMFDSPETREKLLPEFSGRGILAGGDAELQKEIQTSIKKHESKHPVARVIGKGLETGAGIAGFIAGAPGKVANFGTQVIEKGLLQLAEGWAIKFGGEAAEYITKTGAKKVATAGALGAVAAADPAEKTGQQRFEQSAWMSLFGYILPKWLQLGTRLEMASGSKTAAAMSEAIGLSTEMGLYEKAAELFGMTPHDAHAMDDFLVAIAKGDEAGIKKHGERLLVESLGWTLGGGRLFKSPSQALEELRQLPSEQNPVSEKGLAAEIKLQQKMPQGAEQIPGRTAEFFWQGDYYRLRGEKGERLQVRRDGKGKWRKAKEDDLPKTFKENTDFTIQQKMVAEALATAPLPAPLRRMVLDGLKAIESIDPASENYAVTEGRGFLQAAMEIQPQPPIDIMAKMFARVMAGRQSADSALNEAVAKVEPKEAKPKEEKSPELQAIEEFGKEAFSPTTTSEGPPKKGLASKLYELTFNRFEPVEALQREAEKATGIQPKPTADPRKMAAVLTGSEQGIADYFLRRGVTNLAGEKVGPSWKETLSSIPKDMLDPVFYYAAAKRITNLEAEGRSTGHNVDAAKKAVAEGDRVSEVKKGAEGVAKFFDNVMSYLFEAGSYSPKEQQAIREANPFYVPLFRAVEAQAIRRAGSSKGRPLRRLKGKSKLPIQDIQRSAQQYVESIVRSANKIRILQSMARFREGLGEAGDMFMRKVKPPTEPTRVTAEEIQKHIGEGKDLGKLEDLLVFRPAARDSGDIISIRIDGKRQYFKLDPEVRKVFEAEIPNSAVKAITAVNNLLLRSVRAGAVGLSVPFAIKNVFRDAFISVLQGKYIGKIPGVAATKGGIAEVSQWPGIKKVSDTIGFTKAIEKYIKDAEKYEASGAAFSTLPEYFAQAGRRKGKAKTPLDTFAHALGTSERASRREEFVQSYRKARKEGMSENDALIQAAFDAKELIVNYSRKGSAAAALGRFYLFMTPRLGGQDKLVRTFKDKGIATTLGMGFAYITVPELLSWLLHGDEKWWQDKASERQNYTLFKVPGYESPLRIPKAFDWGQLFGTLPIEALHSATQDSPEYIKKSVRHQVTDFIFSQLPVDSFYPTVLRPLAEAGYNENFYSGIPIYPTWMEDKLRDQRKFNLGTTETSKKLGAASEWLSQKFGGDLRNDGISPAIIDHIANSYTGGIWRRTVTTVEDVLGVKTPKTSLSKRIPIVSSFVSEPWTGSRAVHVFYEMQRAHEAMYKDRKETEMKGPALRARAMLKSYRNRMASLRDRRNRGDLSKIEANNQIVDLAWEALGRLDEIEAEASRK